MKDRGQQHMEKKKNPGSCDKDMLRRKLKSATFMLITKVQEYVPLSRITAERLEKWRMLRSDGYCFFEKEDLYGVLRTWKPYDLLTIDFKIGEVHSVNGINVIELLLMSEGQAVTAQRLLSHDDVKSGTVWECSSHGHWLFERERKDKKYPNSVRALHDFLRLHRKRETYQEMRQVLYAYGGIANFTFMVDQVCATDTLVDVNKKQHESLFHEVEKKKKKRRKIRKKRC